MRATPQALHTLVQDLKELLPESKHFPDDDFLGYLFDNLEHLPGSKLQELPALGLKRVPPGIKTQLADYWITYTILGLPDFHPSNWLIHDEKVVGIDVVHAPVHAKDTDPALKIPYHQHPYGFYKIDDQVTETLISSASPELKQYFKTLTRDEVEQLAKNSDYPISSEELDQIMARIRDFNARNAKAN
jgi:hypothetical protein